MSQFELSSSASNQQIMNEVCPVPHERIDSTIMLIRGQKVLLDYELAELYGVETKMLKRAVQRNLERFPPDFLIELTREEFMSLRRQTFGKHGGSRIHPYAFTEQGIAMLSSVLHSPRAVAVNIEIMRAFVRLRQLISTSADLARKLAALEKKYDAQFKIVFDAIRALMTPVTPADKKREIGFHTTLRATKAKAPPRKPASTPAPA
jgi:hypothetical protein